MKKASERLIALIRDEITSACDRNTAPMDLSVFLDVCDVGDETPGIMYSVPGERKDYNVEKFTPSRFNNSLTYFRNVKLAEEVALAAYTYFSSDGMDCTVSHHKIFAQV